MTLETDTLPLTENPSRPTVEAALRGLGEGFAVLARSQQEYVQATAVSGGYLIERREGAADRHYQTSGSVLSLDRTTAAFLAYYDGDSSWAAELSWEKLSL